MSRNQRVLETARDALLAGPTIWHQNRKIPQEIRDKIHALHGYAEVSGGLVALDLVERWLAGCDVQPKSEPTNDR